MRIAAKVRLQKLKHPEQFCDGDARCLYRTGGGPCPKHADVLVPTDRLQLIWDSSDMDGARDAAGRRPHQARFREKLAKPIYTGITPHDAPAKHEPVRLIDPMTGESQVYLSLHDGGRA